MNWQRGFRHAAAFALVVSALAAGAVQDEVKIKASLKLGSSPVKAGSVVKGTLTVTIPEGYHGYQNPPKNDYEIPIKVEAGDKATKLLKAVYPKGVEETFSGTKTLAYSGTITIPVEIKAQAKAGQQTIKLKVSYQLCNEGSCLPPAGMDITAKIKVKK